MTRHAPEDFDQRPRRIAIVTDAWLPQVNGVVTTLGKTKEELEKAGHTVLMITPDPTKFGVKIQDGLRLQLLPGRRVIRQLKDFNPDYTHIATEATLGFAARGFCIRNNKPFSTAFHTRHDDYVARRLGGMEEGASRIRKWFTEAAVEVTRGYLRWFHAPSAAVMATTPSMREDLAKIGLRRLVLWPRGVDTKRFMPQAQDDVDPFERYKREGKLVVGLHSRVDPEKNLPAFLDLDLPGVQKVVIGKGKDLDMLRERYPDVLFTGEKKGDDLVKHVAALNAFVFPSKTDTFGLVLFEAAACGIPIAAFPVNGPIDVFGKYPVPGPSENPEKDECRGFVRLNNDLGQAVREVIDMVRNDKETVAKAARSYVMTHTWKAATDIFLTNLQANTIHRRRRLKPFARKLGLQLAIKNRKLKLAISGIEPLLPYLPKPRKHRNRANRRAP